jgi:hypothetical protein
MIRAIYLKARFAHGFIVGLREHAVRVFVWAGLLMMLAMALGLEPWRTLVVVIAGNILANLIYPNQDELHRRRSKEAA